MRLFITGGTGFVGRWLCRALDGHSLLVLTRQPAEARLPSPCQIVAGDLDGIPAWEDTLRRFRPQVCVHLAWEGLPDYSLAACMRNFQAGLKLFQALHNVRCSRVVVAGTCWEYGSLTGCVNEDQIPDTLGLFAAFKTAQRLAFESLLASTGAELLWARPFFIYGPGQRTTSLIPSVFRALEAGRVPQIQNPDAINDFVFVEDVARGLVTLATGSVSPGTYNLASGQPSRVRDVVNLIARLMNSHEIYPPETQAGSGFWADLTRTKRECGWQPRITLEEGIRRTGDAYKVTA